MNLPSHSGENPILISIFHTNDMHAHLDGMARLSAFSRKLREEAAARGRKAFFWDAGDAADRRIQICSATKGAAFPQILNAMDYTLQTMGNAIALTYGPQAMIEVAARSQFPILAANCRDGDGPLPEGLQECVLIALTDKISMGVIGLTAPWGQAYEVFGLRFPDFREVTRRLIAQLKSDGACLIVILSHLGLEDDRKLADEVSGIDVIIGAHSHDRLPTGELRNNVLVAQAGQYAEAVGVVALNLERDSGRVVSRNATVFDIPSDTPADPAVLASIAAAEGEVQEVLAQPIGELEGPMDQNFFRECDIGNLAADALRARMKAEIAIVSSGLFHRPLDGGILTLGQLDGACFSTANPWLSEVSGGQILEALERGLDPSHIENEPHSFRGAPVGIPQISGMQVYYDESAVEAPRIKSVYIQGQPLGIERLYRLAHTDAEVMAGIGYLNLESGQIIEQEVPTILREVIADYLGACSPMPVPQNGRWVPA